MFAAQLYTIRFNTEIYRFSHYLTGSRKADITTYSYIYTQYLRFGIEERRLYTNSLP